MIKAKLFKKEGCVHCDNVIIPEEGVTVIDVGNEEYAKSGFVPNDLPLLQFGSVVLVGSQHINEYFASAKNIK